jgi:hypothetical protein
MSDPPAKSNGQKADFERSEQKPVALPVNVEGIPSELRDKEQWVCWRYAWRVDKKGAGKWTKVPVNPKNGKNAKANVPSTWGTCDQALAYYQNHRDEVDGIGFEFSPDGDEAGVDIDDAIDAATKDLKPWAAAIVTDLDTYCETSPSGTGVKLYLRGKKPGKECKKPFHDGEVEVYDGGRFFCVTGAHWPGTPPMVEDRQQQLESLFQLVFGDEQPETPEHEQDGATATEKEPDQPNGTSSPPPPQDLTDDEIIDLAGSAKNGDKFRSLMTGDTSSYGDDDSRRIPRCAGSSRSTPRTSPRSSASSAAANWPGARSGSGPTTASGPSTRPLPASPSNTPDAAAKGHSEGPGGKAAPANRPMGNKRAAATRALPSSPSRSP